jgi:tRNA-specific 2-thiouridylase
MRPPVEARVTPLGEGGAEVELKAAEEAIAPGQACVLYDGSRVLGGGWIKAASTVSVAAE